MKNYKTLDFKTFGDKRGFLTPLEGGKEIPFDVKRIFYIYGTKDQDTIRGQHANRKTKFVLIMITGSCKIKIYDNKSGTQEVINLDSPAKGLFIENMVWKKMYNFSNDSVMLALASEHFDEFEYIDTYEEYLQELTTV